jgi:poly-gamma-glutamate capsule biosynthesis protein CapA/YwtB (metallophosphatase superfamily)
MSVPGDLANPRVDFPYAHSGEPGLPRFQRMRAEGRSLGENLWGGLAYLRKYFRAKTSAPPEEVRYFDDQRRLLRFLMRSAPPRGVRLAMVGDLMWLRNGWHTFLSPEVRDHLNGFDVVLGNLESVISRRLKVPSFLPDYVTYNSDPALITSFRRPGGASTFSALATCNNHCLDRGDAGMLDTLDFLDEQHIFHSGVRRRKGEVPYVVFDAGGVRVGFYATSWGLNSPKELGRTSLQIEVLPGLAPRVEPPVDVGPVRRALEGMAEQGAEFRVVYLHWGHEFEFYPDPGIMQVGRAIIGAGADVVMGSHPHVLQPLEVCFVNGYERRYPDAAADLPALRPGTGCVLEDGTGVARKGLIVYSLGNFATAMFTLPCRIGVVVGITLVRDPGSGRVDWERPELTLVYNVPKDPTTGSRRLVSLDRYLQGHPGDDRLKAAATFHKEHLLGKSLT